MRQFFPATKVVNLSAIGKFGERIL